MKDQTCPKCDKVVDPKWHKAKHKGCDDQNGHLHFYCRCGWDWEMTNLSLLLKKLRMKYD